MRKVKKSPVNRRYDISAAIYKVLADPIDKDVFNYTTMFVQDIVGDNTGTPVDSATTSLYSELPTHGRADGLGFRSQHFD